MFTLEMCIIDTCRLCYFDCDCAIFILTPILDTSVTAVIHYGLDNRGFIPSSTIQSAKWLAFETNQSSPLFLSTGFLICLLFDPENRSDTFF